MYKRSETLKKYTWHNTVVFWPLDRYSKQAFLSDVQQPHTLPDSSPSFKDFMGNKNNRFLNPEMASKNRIQPPTKVKKKYVKKTFIHIYIPTTFTDINYV